MKKDRLGIVILDNTTMRIEGYLRFFVERLHLVVDEVVLAYPEMLQNGEKTILEEISEYQICVPKCEKNPEEYVLRELDEKLWEYSTFAIADDSVFGPFYDLTEMFEVMEQQNYDFWGSLKHTRRVRNDEIYADAYLDTCFLVLNRGLIASKQILCFLEANTLADLLKLENEGYHGGAYCDMEEYDFPRGQNDCIYPYYYNDSMIINNRYPFLKCDSFKFVDGIEYGHRENLRKAFEYIQNTLDYDSELIWNYILKKYNIADIKETLHLYYLVDAEKKCKVPTEKMSKCAVIMHLYYGDLLDETLEYVKNIPGEMDVYITTNGTGQMELVEQKLQEYGRERYKVLDAGRRGRDAAALLVVCGKYLMDYEYICFVHDKKTSGGRGPRMVGDSFRNLVFENTVASKTFIENVLEIFRENKYLGFLSPVCPVSKGYLGYFGGFGREWTSCFKKTKLLAEELGLEVPMSEEKQPFALSNAFWCRTEALKKIFEKEWKLEEFDEEPLADDGTLNHAIERIYPYVAQDAGYYSALLLEREFASAYIGNLAYNLTEHLNLIRDNLNFRISRDIETSVKQIAKERVKWLEDAEQKELYRIDNEKKEAYINELSIQVGEKELYRIDNEKKEALINELSIQVGEKELYRIDNEKKEAFIKELEKELEHQKREKELEQGQKNLYVEENSKKEKYINELTEWLGQERLQKEEMERLKQVEREEILEQLREERCKVSILKEAANDKDLYIYGAGKLAKKTVEILHELGMEFEGFIVTESSEQEFLEHPIYPINKIDLTDRKYIILVALNSRNCCEVIPVLEKLEYQYVCPWS